jgi:ribosomal protein L24
MLIYNYKKEFLGIDEVDLQALGFKDLAALQAQVPDFADLFVKTPGYIHNFKHVHWIDFITCADSAEPPKAIILSRGVNYRCHLKITTIYLNDNPTEKAYIVTLQNLRILSENESHSVAADISFKQAQVSTAVVEPAPVFNHFEPAPTKQVAEEFKQPAPEAETFEAYSETVEDVYDDLPLEVDIEQEEYIPAPKVPVQTPKAAEVPKAVEVPKTLKVEVSVPKAAQKPAEETQPHENEYIFDPQVASKELGLPVDLIEEFIQDFIVQAKEFKDELYASLHELDISNVKILSHKLKGVAANLRVADALEVLTVINTTTDFSIIQSNLDKFYRIIAKLAGETPSSTTNTTNVRSEEDEFVVDFKNDDDSLEMPLELSIDDNDVPNAIQMPELADDDFKPTTIEDEPLDLLDIDFDTVDVDELSLEVSEITQLPDTLDTLDNEEALELLDMDDDDIKPVTLLQTQEKTGTEIVYKREVAANEIGLDIESFNELFDDFIDEAKIKSQQISAAIHAENVDLWKLKATKLKGMCENMRVIDLANELDVLSQCSDTKAALNSMNKIDAMILKISQNEA